MRDGAEQQLREIQKITVIRRGKNVVADTNTKKLASSESNGTYKQLYHVHKQEKQVVGSTITNIRHQNEADDVKEQRKRNEPLHVSHGL